MKDKYTINIILISSKWVIPSFGVCYWWINSSSKCFSSFFFRSSISLTILSEPPSKSSQGSSYSFVLHFYLIILFVTGVLHGGSSWFNLFLSSSVHQDFVGGVQLSFLLASRSAINSPYSFELEFCISSFFSAIQSFPFVAGYHLIILRCFP